MGKSICPSCFHAEAERAGVRYRFANVRAMSRSDKPEPARRFGRKRRRSDLCAVCGTFKRAPRCVSKMGSYCAKAGNTGQSLPPKHELRLRLLTGANRECWLRISQAYERLAVIAAKRENDKSDPTSSLSRSASVGSQLLQLVVRRRSVAVVECQALKCSRL